MNKGKDIAQFLKRFNYIFDYKTRARFAVLLVMLVLQAIIETVSVSVMFPFMSAIMESESIFEKPWAQFISRIFFCTNRIDIIVVMSLILVALYLMKGIYSVILIHVKYRLLAKKQSELSTGLFNIILHQPYSYHLHHNTAESQRIVTEDVKRLFELLDFIFVMISESITGLFLLLVLFWTNFTLSLIASILIIASMLLVNRLVLKRIKLAGKENTERNTQMLKHVYQALGGLKAVLVNQRQNYFVEEYGKDSEKFAEVNSDYNLYRAVPRIAIETISMSAIFAIFAFLIQREIDTDRMLPLLATFALAAVRLIPVANRINQSFNGIQFHMNAMDNIYYFMASHELKKDKHEQMQGASLPAEKLETGIVVENISFHYPDTEQWLYQNLTLQIPAGKSTAFIGVTGAGKTTLADIILGLHKPQEGSIKVDETDIFKNRKWWSERIGYIPQTIYLSEDTIRANVAYGIEKNKIDDRQVLECLEKAQIADFVKKLPDGINTVTGENGLRLSGGQKQRIGIARALYGDPPFLVLDEATSALDNETEQAFIEIITKFSGKKTLLIIAHRLNTIRHCDRIFRIENGQAVREK